MTQENVEVVREVCAYWERGDWAARRELFDPDLEAVFSASSFPDAGTYHGRPSAVDAWGRWLDAWEEFSLEVGDAIDAGAAIVVLIRIRGRGKGSGAAVDADVGIIFKCDRDVITQGWSSATGSVPSKPPGCRSSPVISAGVGQESDSRARAPATTTTGLTSPSESGFPPRG